MLQLITLHPILIVGFVVVAVVGITRLLRQGFSPASGGEEERKAALPPLVPGLPYVGNALQVNRANPHSTLTEWSKTTGHVYRFRVFGQDTVVLNSRDAIREGTLRTGNALAGRPYIFRIKHGFHGADDVIFGNFSERWSFMKTLISKALRPYGSGNKDVEAIVREEMGKLVELIGSRGGDEFDPAIIVLTAVVNAMSATIVGKRYDHDSAKMRQYKETTRLFSEACSVVDGMELDMAPWLRFLPNKSFKKLTTARDMLDQLIDQELSEAKERFDQQTPRCILDELLMRLSADTSCGVGASHKLTETDVRSLFIDLIVGGTLTTSIALYSFVLLMTHHQAEQRALQKEIDAVLGRGGSLPCVRDRSLLPGVEAAICEVLRLVSHVPLSLPHFAVEEATVSGYRIPKNTQVLLNLWALHHDPLIWEEPWKFKPERFLDSSGNLLPSSHERMKSFLPFGLGRRVCLGELLARERLFLFSTCLLQNFSILPTEDADVTAIDPRNFQLGLILEPLPFKARFVSR